MSMIFSGTFSAYQQFESNLNKLSTDNGVHATGKITAQHGLFFLARERLPSYSLQATDHSLNRHNAV